MRKRNIVTVLCLTAAVFGGAAPTALAHQHINPSGTCAADVSSVPQDNPENPAGQVPGNQNSAPGNEQGTTHCP